MAGRDFRRAWRHPGRDPRREIDEELAFHFEERVRAYVAQGMTPEEARAAATERLGDLGNVREECSGIVAARRRRRRRRDLVAFSWLDFKLGLRMLVRYPGMTLVGGLATAFGICVGAGTFELSRQWMAPDIRLDSPDQVVGILLRDVRTGRPGLLGLRSFTTWRSEIESIHGLSAFRMFDANFITDESAGDPVQAAETSASAFRVTGAHALLGRVLLEADEQPSASPVVVIGYDLWQERFGGDNHVLGTTVRLGLARATVVGVMPPGFAFPSHQDLWVPLRSIGAGADPGPAVRTFGRLAPGVTLEQALAELNRTSLLAAASPDGAQTHLRVEVVPYARSIVGVAPNEIAGLRTVNIGIVLLVLLAFANVALLTFARAATREGEIVVRSALGAGRWRITAQLFAEALVLGGVGLAMGLLGARYGIRWALFIIRANLGDLPYWITDKLSPATLLYAGGLTALAALMAGVVPALRVTRGLGGRLQRISTGSGGLHFGGFWTAVIVGQVAITVILPVTPILIWRSSAPIRSFRVAFPEQEYLVARLELDSEQDGETSPESGAAYATRFSQTLGELSRRLSAETAVRGVTFTDRPPHMYHPERRVEVVEGVPTADSVRDLRVKAASVAPGYFDLLGATILAGRGFRSADTESGARVVIANQSFVTEVLGGRNPIGRRLRFGSADRQPDRPPDPWYEIVGVVKDLGMYHEGSRAGLYLPLAAGAPGTDHSVYMMLRVRGDPASFAVRAREIAREANPTLRLYEPRRLDQLGRDLSRIVGTFMRIALIAALVALILSLAGVYSILSFAVSRRTREIGIRVALGASSAGVLFAVFRKPLGQVTLGVLVGAFLVSLQVRSSVGRLTAGEIVLMGAYIALMLGVCLVAGTVPTRRALRIEPSDALREE